MVSSQNHASTGVPNTALFWCCFIALISTSFGFIVRAFSIGDWGVEFGLSATQKGQILGVGLWPFAISIVLFSLIIDKIGYKIALGFAFVCHLLSVIITIRATGYSSLYLGTFIAALGNGTVEAVANPVVATMFNKDKAKWLNRLHGGWPGGLALGGVLAIALQSFSWKVKLLLILIPTLVYGVMMIPIRFPVNERVAAGVSYKDMLKEFGALGMLIVMFLVFSQLFSIWPGTFLGLENPLIQGLVCAIVVSVLFGFYVRTLGHPLFVLMLLIMVPLATTELGIDGWVTDLMGPVMGKIGLNAGWIIVYTSAIMTVLRFFAGPLVHKFSPLGLLAICTILAAVGLYCLSFTVGIGILVAATLYGIAKSFFWPTMLAVVSERFPKGGALTLNATGGVGMLGVGVIGLVLMGSMQDHTISKELRSDDQQNGTSLYSTYVTQEKTGLFGSYKALDQDKVSLAPSQDQMTIQSAVETSKVDVFRRAPIFPLFVFVCFIGIILYFRSQGGYKAVHLTGTEGAGPGEY